MWTKLVIPQVIELLPHARKLLDDYLTSRRETRGGPALPPRTLDGNAPDPFATLMAEHVALQQVADAQSAAIERLSTELNALHASVATLERTTAEHAARSRAAFAFAIVSLLAACAAVAVPLLHHAR